VGLSSPLSLSLVSGISGYKWSPTGLNDSDSIMLFEVVSPLVIFQPSVSKDIATCYHGGWDLVSIRNPLSFGRRT